MITFQSDKDKDISLEISTEGIDPKNLQFTFCILYENVKYGFHGVYENGTLNFNIPKLTQFLKEVKSGDYDAKIEAYGIVEDNAGYYNLLWDEKVLFENKPKIQSKMINNDSKNITENKKEIKIKNITENKKENKKEKVIQESDTIDNILNSILDSDE